MIDFAWKQFMLCVYSDYSNQHAVWHKLVKIFTHESALNPIQKKLINK